MKKSYLQPRMETFDAIVAQPLATSINNEVTDKPSLAPSWDDDEENDVDNIVGSISIWDTWN